MPTCSLIFTQQFTKKVTVLVDNKTLTLLIELEENEDKW